MIELFLLLALLLILYKRWSNPINKIPGPKGHLIYGNALQLNRKHPHIDMAELGKKYGGLYKLRMFFTTQILVTDPDLLFELLVTRGSEFAGRHRSVRSELINDGRYGVVLADPDQQHKARRKVIQNYAKQYGTGMKRIEEITITATDDMLAKFVKYGDKAFEVRTEVFYCIINVITIMLIGEAVGDEGAKEIKDIIDNIFKAIGSDMKGRLLDLIPALRHLRISAYTRLQKSTQVKDKLIKRWFDSKPLNGFISHLQTMSPNDKSKNFMSSYKHDSTVITEFLIAGIYTSSTTLTCLMNILAHKPEVQKRLQEEVSRVIGTAKAPTVQDRQDLPYHRATLLEVGRFASIVPSAVQHKTTKDTTLGGFTLPAGTEVIPHLWAMHHDETLWDEPFVFKPERFVDKDGDVIPADHPNRRNLMPFGAGVRVCAGELLATTRMFLVLARIMQTFTILPETTIDKQPSIDPRDMSFGPVLSPPPFKIRIKMRND